jgi:hypothetical protein
LENGSQIGVQTSGTGSAKSSIQLVDFAIGINAGVTL